MRGACLAAGVFLILALGGCDGAGASGGPPPTADEATDALLRRARGDRSDREIETVRRFLRPGLQAPSAGVNRAGSQGGR